MAMMNDTLRTAIAADLTPVQPLASPARRAMTVVPLAVVLLVAAPLVFAFRDLAALGWFWSWGASIVQTIVGVTVITLALREAVPGRSLGRSALVTVISAVALLLLAVTFGSWSASPITVARAWWEIGGMCLVGSATSALPAIVLASILVVRAFPLQPARTGAMAGLGAGLLADAGWRLFCHFSEPAHVVIAHLGGVAAAALIGAGLTTWLVRRERRT
jgi:hypothetical protein